tara:strand:- start:593 stop:748 length:156 start_codon:yes stop_codon:yes gene_type:complete
MNKKLLFGWIAIISTFNLFAAVWLNDFGEALAWFAAAVAWGGHWTFETDKD